MERKIKAAQNDGGLSRDAAIEEVVAEACEMVMGNSKAIERLAKEKPGLAKRIADWLHEFFSDIRKAFEGVEARHEEAKAMLDYMDELTKLWDDALVEAAENRGGTQKGSSTKFSNDGRKSNPAESEKIRPGMDDQQRTKILESKRIQAPVYDTSNKVNAAEIQRLKGMYISRAGEIFKTIAEKCGVFRTYRNEDVGITFSYSRSGLQESKHKQIERGGTAEDFGKMLTVLPQIIDGAVEIDAHTDRYAGTAREDNRLKEMHVLLGAFRDGTDVIPVQLEIKEYLPEVQQANKLYVTVTLTTKEAGIMPGLHASQNETLSAGTPASEIRIADILRNVNDQNGKLVKYLPDSMLNEEQRAAKEKALEKDREYLNKLRERQVNERRESARGRRDSAGNKLSQQQQEFFKDSKVRDKRGNLKVMYHGTPNGTFTVFNDGTYFTENKEYADLYQNPGASMLSVKKTANAPKTYEVYLNIKKPFDIRDAEARDIYINDYIKGGNAVGINPYMSDAEYRKIKTVDWTEGEDLRDFLIDNGYDYDGLILDEGATGGYGDKVKSRGVSYVIFSADQVKNIDNKNPTSDPDIRFSRRDSAEGLTKEEARAQAAAYTRLKAENAELQRRVEYWKGQTQRTKQATVRQTAPTKMPLPSSGAWRQSRTSSLN